MTLPTIRLTRVAEGLTILGLLGRHHTHRQPLGPERLKNLTNPAQMLATKLPSKSISNFLNMVLGNLDPLLAMQARLFGENFMQHPERNSEHVHDARSAVSLYVG